MVEYFEKIGWDKYNHNIKRYDLLIFCYCPCAPIGIFILQFWKYQALYEYLMDKKLPYAIPNGRTILLLNIFVGPLTIFILPIYFEWKWQNIMNELIKQL
jgi:hypothetical protein